MKDVVKLQRAIDAATEALRERFGTLIPPSLREQVARAAVEAAAEVLDIADVDSIPDSRIREPLPQSGNRRDGVVHTHTVQYRGDLL